MELPELTVLSRQMTKEIVGKRISGVEVANPKCLNMPFSRFRRIVVGRNVESVDARGKWLFVKLGSGYVLLFNPGMGADIIRFKPRYRLPEKHQIRFTLDDGAGFTIRVWWFCYLHLMQAKRLGEHKLTRKLGPTPLDERFTLDYFRELLRRGRGSVKTFLLDQKNIAGIGNVYIQDMLFKAGLHPKRILRSLTDMEIAKLYRSMRSILERSVELGGLAYERDFYGRRGRFAARQFKVAYKSDKPCPVCRTTIRKIKTGSTSSYICPTCQPLTA